MDFEGVRRQLFCQGLMKELQDKPTKMSPDKVNKYVQDALMENIKEIYEDDQIIYARIKMSGNYGAGK